MFELEIINLAWKACKAYFKESLLIIFATCVGVWAIGLSQGVFYNTKSKILQKIDSIGQNCICIFPANNKAGARSIKFYEYCFIKKIFEKRFGSSAVVTPVLLYKYSIFSSKLPAHKFSNLIICIKNEALKINKRQLSRGRFFNKSDNHKKVCIIGSSLAKRFDKTITFDGLTFLIIGVLAQAPQLNQQNPNEDIYIPFELANVLLNDTKTIHEIVIGLESENLFSEAILLVNKCLEKLRNVKTSADKDWTVFDQATFRQTSLATTDLLRNLIIFFAIIIMFLCFLSSVNSIILNVRTRKTEIELMLQIGISRTVVFRQFLYESLFKFAAGLTFGLLMLIFTEFFVARFLQIENMLTIYTGLLIAIYVGLTLTSSIIIAQRAVKEDF